MAINPANEKEFIELAQSQMALRGEIDALIFITHDVSNGLRNAREYLDKVKKELNVALQSIADETRSGEG
jgi:hypothetical protein